MLNDEVKKKNTNLKTLLKKNKIPIKRIKIKSDRKKKIKNDEIIKKIQF